MQSPNFYFFTCLCMAIFVTGCTTQDTKPIPTPIPESPYTFVDSTLFFNDRKSSISLRATFDKETSFKMQKGYTFQFRTIAEKPIFLSSVSIIAGGKRFFLKKGQLLLSPQESITLNLSVEDSVFAASFQKVLLQFRQNNASEIFIIESHQLDTFVPLENI